MIRIGVLYGTEDSFPPALVERINSLQVPGIVAEHLKVGGVRMASPCPYGVIVDRVSHEIPFYRSYLKSAALTGTKVLNNPFWRSADDRFFHCSLARRLGLATPETVLLPHRDHPENTTERSMRNLEYPLDWDGIFQYVGFPAFLKGAFLKGNDAKCGPHPVLVNSAKEFFAAYHQTGRLSMMLQRAVDMSEYYRCYVVNQQRVHIVRYDPTQPEHLRHVAGNPAPAPLVGERMVRDALTLCRALGYDLNAVDFAVYDGVPQLIDSLNPVPDASYESVGAESFEWIVNAVADMAIRRAEEPPCSPDLRWSRFLGATPAG